MTIEIRLLGMFEVRRGGKPVPASAWSRRHAAALVTLLALSPGRRLHREQVFDALWPDLGVDEAAPRCWPPLASGRTTVLRSTSGSCAAPDVGY